MMASRCTAGELVVVADSLNHRVQLFSRDGTFLHAFGRKGRSAGEFDMPGGVAVGTVGAAAAAAADGRGRPPDTHIVVTDQGNGRVQLFERDGTFVRTVSRDGEETGPALEMGLEMGPEGGSSGLMRESNV